MSEKKVLVIEGESERRKRMTKAISESTTPMDTNANEFIEAMEEAFAKADPTEGLVIDSMSELTPKAESPVQAAPTVLCTDEEIVEKLEDVGIHVLRSAPVDSPLSAETLVEVVGGKPTRKRSEMQDLMALTAMSMGMAPELYQATNKSRTATEVKLTIKASEAMQEAFVTKAVQKRERKRLRNARNR